MSTQAVQQLSLFDFLPTTQVTVRHTSLHRSKWDSFKFIDLFAGIGGIRLGFEHVGGQCAFSSEWDKKAAQTYYANFGEYPAGDITKIRSDDIPDFDILLGGFPCQPFSIIGDKEGFCHETQGTLFFEIERILHDKKPKAFMLENVRNLTAHDGGKTLRIIINHLKNLGYYVYYKVLNALHYGVPQKRERIIICGFLDDVNFKENLSILNVAEYYGIHTKRGGIVCCPFHDDKTPSMKKAIVERGIFTVTVAGRTVML